MLVVVEPQTGDDFERLITALLNVTGAVHRVVEGIDHPPTADGVEIIGLVAERLRQTLAPVSEHMSDEELALVTGVLAQTTLLIAGGLGLEGFFGVG